MKKVISIAAAFILGLMLVACSSPKSLSELITDEDTADLSKTVYAELEASGLDSVYKDLIISVEGNTLSYNYHFQPDVVSAEDVNDKFVETAANDIDVAMSGLKESLESVWSKIEGCVLEMNYYTSDGELLHSETRQLS